MSQIQWSGEFETGNEQIDTQHQHLVEIVNKFDSALQKGKGRRVMGEILRDLVGYTQEHFTCEEAIMAEAEYSQLKLHQAQHRQLLAKVERFQFDFSQGKRLSRDMQEFLKYWLMNHIRVDDMAFAASDEATVQSEVEDPVPT